MFWQFYDKKFGKWYLISFCIILSNSIASTMDTINKSNNVAELSEKCVHSETI